MGEDERAERSGARAEAESAESASAEARVEAASARRASIVRRPPVRIVAGDGSTPPRAVPKGESIQLKGEHVRGLPGTFQWSTTSDKITLADTDAEVVTVNAGDAVSAEAGDEEVSLVFTPEGEEALPQVKVGLTVISVEFRASDNQRFGYDDLDGAAGTQPHVSVQRTGSTVVQVTIRGGASADVLRFTSEDDSMATAEIPQNAQSSFDLTIRGGSDRKVETTVHARANADTGPICASLKVNVYHQKNIEARVGKFQDSHSSSSSLSRPRFDVAKARDTINQWYKAAVTQLEQLTDIHSTGGATDVRYDLNDNGVLDLEAGAISAEEQALRDAFSGSGRKIFIIKDLAMWYFLAEAASTGDTTIRLRDSCERSMRNLKNGSSYQLGLGSSFETITIASKSGTTVTLSSALTRDHPATHGIRNALNGLAKGIIFVKEDGLTEAEQTQVVGHELAHGRDGFALKDLECRPALMHYTTQQRTDTKIRFKEFPLRYDTGNENQWDVIAR